jgi:hypothetical protein
MVLIQQHLLNALWIEHGIGVPVAKLIERHKLPMARPTLAKLLSYVTTSETAPPAVQAIIDASLYPEWLENPTPVEQDANFMYGQQWPASSCVIQQPPTWRYEGKMPLGKWVRNEWAIPTTSEANHEVLQ